MSIVHSAEVEVRIDEDGNIHKHIDGVDVDQDLGYKFGPIASTSFFTPKPWSILNELFPDTAESISSAWEKYPVHLPARTDSDSDSYNKYSELAQIIYNEQDNDSKSQSQNSARFSHLFKVDDSLTVLQQNKDLKHGTDFLILKLVMRDGEEWNGRLPHEHIPVTDIPDLLNHQAFSLVINKLEQYWSTVKDFAMSLELETCAAVSCNLYLTPPRSGRAFESHMDWMDVIVLQIEGEKRWSVGRNPMNKLLLPDQKRKPTMEELKASPFDDVLLRPGDALYIPRGHLHNATTPTDGSGGYSLHLTFGIQHRFETTMEALIHHAVEMFRKELVNSNEYVGKLAVPSGLCEERLSLTWEKLLHYSISGLARQTDCGGFAETNAVNRNEDNEAICSLRESIPLHPQFQALKQRSDDDIEKKYKDVIYAITRHADFMDSLNFMNAVVFKERKGDDSLGSSSFQYIGMDAYEPFGCRPPTSVDRRKEKFKALTESFHSFASERFHDARQQLMDSVKMDRTAKWMQDKK